MVYNTFRGVLSADDKLQSTSTPELTSHSLNQHRQSTHLTKLHGGLFVVPTATNNDSRNEQRAQRANGDQQRQVDETDRATTMIGQHDNNALSLRLPRFLPRLHDGEQLLGFLAAFVVR